MCVCIHQYVPCMLLYCLRQYETQITGEKESKEVHGFENYEQKGKGKKMSFF